MSVTGVAAGMVDLLRSTFNEYCKVQVGRARLLYDPSAPKMSQAQFLMLCQDIGVLEPEGGNLSASSIVVIFTSYKPVNQQAMPFQYFVRSLSALSTAARLNVHQLVADLAGHVPQPTSVLHVGKIRPYSAMPSGAEQGGMPESRRSLPGGGGGRMQRGDLDTGALADGWPPGLQGENAAAGPAGERQRFACISPNGGAAELDPNGVPYDQGYGLLDPAHGAYSLGGSGYSPSPSQALKGGNGGFNTNGAVRGPWDGVPLHSVSENGGRAGSDIPAWTRSEGMPEWLRSLMVRLDALDDWYEHAGGGGAAAAAAGAGAVDVQTPPRSKARSPLHDREQRSASLGAGAGAGAGAAAAQQRQVADLRQEVAEVKQMVQDLGQQVGALTSRVQRVEAQQQRQEAESSGDGGSGGQQARPDGDVVQARQTELQELRRTVAMLEEQQRRLEHEQQQLQQEQRRQEKDATQAAADAATAAVAATGGAAATPSGSGGSEAVARLEEQVAALQALVQSQQGEMQAQGAMLATVTEFMQELQQREHNKQAVLAAVLAKQETMRESLTSQPSYVKDSANAVSGTASMRERLPQSPSKESVAKRLDEEQKLSRFSPAKAKGDASEE